ncbi:hypothetical protein [Paenibacillus daejeonensis]|uniref:hypothetical protein n=1 Tax=Paenibacillus daejeonensis TaxID=135193 RepID=UPI00035DDE05|nr:hypothetical protein [Paenibacillus daejeonensis]
MPKKRKTQVQEQLQTETMDIAFTTEMADQVINRLDRPIPWWQREIRIHVPGALVTACLAIGLVFWFSGSPAPEPSQATGPLVALDSGIFLESDLREWISGK